jgi:rhamnulokinase
MEAVKNFAAVDLGASSGRVIVGRLSEGRLELQEAARFPNGPTQREDGIHWDTASLFAEVKAGIQAAIELTDGQLASVGVDTWGVDYGRLDAAGELLEEPFHYRDLRTADTVEEVFAKLPPERLYAACGLQVLNFNTIFQYAAQAGDPGWSRVRQVLLMPDLFSYWLSGRQIAEVTMASTTGLLDVTTRQWSADTLQHLAQTYGLPFPAVLPPLVEPGTVLGPTLPELFTQQLQVVAVAGHDTASAVVSVPSTSRNFAFISSGTWSLVGMELDAPVLSEASREADFTNELGADGTTRYLKNVMGLWVLNECLRNWREQGREQNLVALIESASALPALQLVVDIDDERLMPPQDMPATLRTLAAELGQELPDDPVAITRCIMDSLALAYRRAVRKAAKLSGQEADVVHIVGGGSQNKLLCQLTAEATGLPVVAGPVEGTAMGNLLIQARAMGAISGDLKALRQVAIASSDFGHYSPGALGIPATAWDQAAQLIKKGN